MQLAERTLGYETRFGRGFISGVFSVALAALGFGGVLCLRFPSFLTTPDARALYPLDLIRFLIHLHLVAGFGLGVLSIVLSRRARLGLSGIGLVVAATLLGGSQAPIGTLGGTRYLGLDPANLNVNGGSISIGHPFGMTGSRMVGTIANEMLRRKARYGVVTMCIGGGQGAAGLFEACN